MKKRNKKYVPNKAAKLVASNASKKHVLEMTFNVEEANKAVDQWREDNECEDGDFTPKEVVYGVYHGDLILCLKSLLIPLEQEWFFGVDSHYYNMETDEVMTIPAQFQMPKMSFKDFRDGCDLKVDRGHGLKSRWKGLGNELEDILDADAPKGFTRVRSDALLRVETAFNNAIDYLYFKNAKSLRQKGVAV